MRTAEYVTEQLLGLVAVIAELIRLCALKLELTFQSEINDGSGYLKYAYFKGESFEILNKGLVTSWTLAPYSLNPIWCSLVSLLNLELIIAYGWIL